MYVSTTICILHVCLHWPTQTFSGQTKDMNLKEKSKAAENMKRKQTQVALDKLSLAAR